MKIWANTIVNNEENFIWFSIMSVIDYVDKILVWDTGSTDNTVKIIEEIKKIKGDKIDFKQVGSANAEQFSKLRQQMLEDSKCDWILVLDGDEVWWKKSIQTLVEKIKQEGNKLDGIVVPMIIPVGDIYHFQDQDAGKYEMLGRKGHLSLRAINRHIKGLHVDWPYGKESYFDGDNKLIQERENIIFLDSPYFHLTHLQRSSKKRTFNKVKLEIGRREKDFNYPEIFYMDYPSIISTPWKKISGMALVKSAVLTPMRKLKRSIT